jgi:hypothetical protein
MPDGIIMDFARLEHEGVQQVTGSYDGVLKATWIRSPTHAQCEKNWIPLPDGNWAIYSWHPWRLVNLWSGDLVPVHETPRFFQHARGSTTLCPYEGCLYCIVHLVVGEPRRYHHVLCRFSEEALEHTVPFFFLEDGVEYCLSLDIQDGIASTVISRNDANPTLVRMRLADFEFRPV